MYIVRLVVNTCLLQTSPHAVRTVSTYVVILVKNRGTGSCAARADSQQEGGHMGVFHKVRLPSRGKTKTGRIAR